MAYEADNDLEDSDFFEQLVNDLGDEDSRRDKGSSIDDDGRLEDAFSKLNVDGHGGSDASAPAVPSAMEQSGSGSDDFWLEENLLALDNEESKKESTVDGEGGGFPLPNTSSGSESSVTAPPSADLKSIDSAPPASHEMSIQGHGNEARGSSTECLALHSLVENDGDEDLGSSSVDGPIIPQVVETSTNGEPGLSIEGDFMHSVPQIDGTDVSRNLVPPVDDAILPASVMGNVALSMEVSMHPPMVENDASGNLYHNTSMDGLPSIVAETIVNGDVETSGYGAIVEPIMVENNADRDLGNSLVDGDAAVVMALDRQIGVMPATLDQENAEGIRQLAEHLPSVDHASAKVVPNAQVNTNKSIEPESLNSVPGNDISVSPSPAVKVLDWSSFGGTSQSNSFGSYSDFFSSLGEHEDSSLSSRIGAMDEKNQIESASVETSFAQVGWRDSEQMKQPGGYDDAEFWNQPDVIGPGAGGGEPVSQAHITTATVVEYNDSGIGGTIGNNAGNAPTGIEGDVSTGIESQQQDVQSWENMYPGWYYDYTTNEWKQDIQATSSVIDYQSYTNVAQVDQSYNNFSDPSSSFDGSVGNPAPMWQQVTQEQSSWPMPGTTLPHAHEGSINNQVATLSGSSWEQRIQGQGSWSTEGIGHSLAQEGPVNSSLPMASWQESGQVQSSWSAGGIEHSLAQEGPIKSSVTVASWQESGQVQSSWSAGGVDPSFSQKDIDPALLGSSWQQTTTQVQTNWSMGQRDASVIQEGSINPSLPGLQWQGASEEKNSWPMNELNALPAQEGSSIDHATTLPGSSSWQQMPSQDQGSWSMGGSGLGAHTQISNSNEYVADTQVSSNDQYAMNTQLSSNDQYGNTGDGLALQHDAGWESQYPGWYYDYTAQEWRQTAEDTAFNQEVSQVSDGSTSSQLPSSTWTEGQNQSYYQGDVNQSVYWSGNNQSSYASDTNVTTTLNRGMLFHAWADPKAQQLNMQQLQAGSNAESVNEGFQGANAQFWPGFQDNTIHSNYNYGFQESANASGFNSYGSQNDHGLSGSTAFSGNQPARANLHSADSSAGRPLHPLAVFGFGGKLIVMKASQMGKPEPIVSHDLNQLVSSAGTQSYNDGVAYFSALNHRGLTFPLIGAGPTSKELVKWIDERIEKCENEDRHCTSSEALSVLWGVLKIACSHYGKLRSLGGSGGLKSQVEDGPEVALGKLLSTKNQRLWNVTGNPGLDALSMLPRDDQVQKTVHEVEVHLMDGKRKEALHLAQKGHLWGLALVLAWQLGEKAYSDTILQMAQQQFLPGSPMRTLLLLFAGQTAELFSSQNVLLSAGTQGPFLPGSSTVKDSAGGMLGDWLGNLSVIAANPTKGDEQVITHLGDSLWKDLGEVAGAHTCYLVADASFESFSREARLCLLGADHFKHQRTYATPLAIQRTEIFEYAKVLGNSQYVLVPFQPYKLLYAYMLAEAGKISEASRYCQVVIKALKNAGRAPEIEFCKQSASVLEERLRLHSQSGYSMNFSGKLVGRVMGTIDSTIHKIIGGPHVPQAEKPVPAPATMEWSSNSQKFGNMSTPVKPTNEQSYGYSTTPSKAMPIGPSASINSLVNTSSNQVDLRARSVSEPNLSFSPAQEVQKPITSSETSSSSPKKVPKPQQSTGGYFRFGTQILSKAVELIKPNKHQAKLGDENKFYYDEKLKRWVETGAEQSQEEAVLAPPPMATKFSSSTRESTLMEAKPSAESQGPGSTTSSTLSSSADLPPMPPAVNQFSARGRLQGVRSRYVDTFNKGNTPSPAKPTESPIVPTVGWGKAVSPSQFFAGAPATPNSNESLSNGNTAGGDVMVEGEGSNNALPRGRVQGDHEPLLPKDLSSSFMAVPLAQRHSSASELSMLSSDMSSRNMSRAVSWSGEAPKVQTQKPAFQGNTTSTAATTLGQVLPNGVSSSLPLPPVIEPPSSYSSIGSGHHVPPPTSLHGGIYGEMQEVEL